MMYIAGHTNIGILLYNKAKAMYAYCTDIGGNLAKTYVMGVDFFTTKGVPIFFLKGL